MAKGKNEIEFENKDVYIEIEPENSLELKKALLEITASNINMQIIAERLKEKTRQELKERTLAKRSLRETAEKIAELIERLPKTKDIPVHIQRQIREESKEILPKKEKPFRESSYVKELEDIKRKISELQ